VAAGDVAGRLGLTTAGLDALGLMICRNGEDGRRCRARALGMTARFGELFLSDRRRSGSRTEVRVGDVGKASSTGFLGRRTLFGDAEGDGLCGRACGA
jgi:hypothetical protein